ncbi:type IV secretion system protein [Sphingopyxis sp. DBS4]|uniref:type IV secretion system protein n=1 Tax=Sphingopyxis sp. DBS4 TaxID=2968500 RepID=UPI00214CF994|nr:type IV secretion system protein [Sphingopyxis sp. DBS4]
MKCYMIAALLGASAAGLGVAGPASPAQAMPVFDSANYSQNLLTAARTLQQINQQIQSLQNEAQMLVNQQKNLARIDFPELDRLREKLGEIDRLMGQAQGIDFRVDRLDERYRQLFPGSADDARRHRRQVALHTIQGGDKGGAGAAPDIKERD